MAGGEGAYPSSGCSLAVPRAVGGRCGAAAVLTAATKGLSLVREPRLVRERFEEQVRALVRARSVVLRDGPGDPKRHPNTVSLDVPATSPDRRTRIEAVFDASERLDDWTRQVLEAGAHVAALLLELEYARGRPFLRPARDGAAPLIGSSPAIQQVRDRIERVAATDFTVLIEGAFDPQPHPGFIDLFAEAAPNDGNGLVAGAGEEDKWRAATPDPAYTPDENPSHVPEFEAASTSAPREML